MKSLNLTFKGSLGKTHSLKLAYANDGLDKKIIKDAMDQLAELQIFSTNGEKLYETPVAAKYVETITTPVFSVTDDPATSTTI